MALVSPFAATVDWIYAGLIRTADATTNFDTDAGLGGRLFYAGELDGAGCALVVAANIAGAASLTATADQTIQKQAIRDGVIDFLVTTLDEALRILKNEVRKRQTVAVCVAQHPQAVERDMVELGALPDLLPPGALYAPQFQAFIEQGARQINPVSADKNQTVLTWSVDAAPALRLPKLDAIAVDCLGPSQEPEVWPAKRWMRLAPSYLGRLTKGARLLRCSTKAAHCFLDQVREQVECGQLDAIVEIDLSSRGRSEQYRFSPSAAETVGGLSRVHCRRPQSGPTTP